MYYFFISGRIVAWNGLLCRDGDGDAAHLADLLERATDEDVAIIFDPLDDGSVYSTHQLQNHEIERLEALMRHEGVWA
jgi:hypothetical protein